MKKFLLLIIFLQLASCQNKPNGNAVELVKKANKIGMESLYKDPVKNDEALKLIDQAIEIDDNYFAAYQAKAIFLTAKKDFDGLLKNNSKIIALRPNQPMWKIQRGLLLEIKGDKIEAQENYTAGLNQYKEILNQKEMYQDFNFRIEYISALEANEQLNQAKVEIEKLRNDFKGNEIVETYVKEYKLRSKAELIDLWRNGDRGI